MFIQVGNLLSGVQDWRLALGLQGDVAIDLGMDSEMAMMGRHGAGGRRLGVRHGLGEEPACGKSRDVATEPRRVCAGGAMRSVSLTEVVQLSVSIGSVSTPALGISGFEIGIFLASAVWSPRNFGKRVRTPVG